MIDWKNDLKSLPLCPSRSRIYSRTFNLSWICDLLWPQSDVSYLKASEASHTFILSQNPILTQLTRLRMRHCAVRAKVILDPPTMLSSKPRREPSQDQQSLLHNPQLRTDAQESPAETRESPSWITDSQSLVNVIILKSLIFFWVICYVVIAICHNDCKEISELLLSLSFLVWEMEQKELCCLPQGRFLRHYANINFSKYLLRDFSMLRTELDPGDLQNRLIMLQDNINTFSSQSQPIPEKGRVNTPVWRHWKRETGPMETAIDLASHQLIYPTDL